MLNSAETEKGAFMNKDERRPQLEALARELAKHIKTEKDLSNLSRELTKMTVETALGAEMEEHLGYGRHERSDSENSRNGYSSKRLIGDHGEVEIDVPRDRQSSFEPQIVEKGQTRLTHFGDQILALYAKGMSTRDIVAAFEEMYGAKVSAGLISKVTEAVLEKVIAWQNRPLDELYPIVYLDCIMAKTRQDRRVINKAIYIALGINLDARRAGYLHCLRGRTDGLSGRHQCRVFPDEGAAVHRAHGAQLATLRFLEGSQEGGRRSAENLSVGQRGGSRAGTGCLCRWMGWQIPIHQPDVASALAESDHAV